MATLAALLKSRGYDVRGSDQNVYPPMSDFLREQGITTLQGYRAEHISADIDLVVVGNAISRGNAELEEVLDRKIRYCSLPEAVRDHFLWGARSIVIAGTHGKTTTTSLTGWLLAHGGADPNVFIGGIAENFESSYRLGGGREFVIEGDEYDSAFFDKTAKFLKYLPDIAVVNNIEFDHADIYPDLAAIRLAFQRFVNLIPRRGLLLLGADNAEAAALAERAHCRVETFGLSSGADWQAHDLQVDGTSTTFSVRRRGEPIGTFELPLLGAFNVRNALAALGGRRGGRIEHRHDGGGAQGVQGRAPAHGAARHRRRGLGLRRLRPPSDRDRRDAGRRAHRVSAAGGSGRSSSRAPRPPAAASSSPTSPVRCRRPIPWCCRRSSAPACPRTSGSRPISSSPI